MNLSSGFVPKIRDKRVFCSLSTEEELVIYKKREYTKYVSNNIQKC